jgi:hypothetical protein
MIVGPGQFKYHVMPSRRGISFRAAALRDAGPGVVYR